jgi:L-iditol 2-dehydrogenase
MRLAEMPEPGRFELVDVEDPVPAPHEVVLDVAACGVCASELDMFSGAAGHASYPWRPGHEVSGTVCAAGSEVSTLPPGAPVAAWVTTRGFAERVAVPEAHCAPAGDVPLDLALGEPLACAVNAVELAGIGFGDDVVIVGAGFMGLTILQLVRLRGPRHVVVVDVRADALEHARALGATHTIDGASGDASREVAELTDGRGADVTIEATGSPAALAGVGDLTRMSGTIVIAGYHQGEPRPVPMATWNWMAFRIANAHFREPSTILHGLRAGMRLLTAGLVSFEGLVTHRFGLDEIGDAFRTAIDKPSGFVKATVTP